MNLRAFHVKDPRISVADIQYGIWTPFAIATGVVPSHLLDAVRTEIMEHAEDVRRYHVSLVTTDELGAVLAKHVAHRMNHGLQEPNENHSDLGDFLPMCWDQRNGVKIAGIFRAAGLGPSKDESKRQWGSFWIGNVANSNGRIRVCLCDNKQQYAYQYLKFFCGYKPDLAEQVLLDSLKLASIHERFIRAQFRRI